MNFGKHVKKIITEASEVEEEYKNELNSLDKSVTNE